MADVRALLKAKRQEARISHPYATYTQSGLLKCVACTTTVKHASAWEGHLGSKAHRTNVVRMREIEQQRILQEQQQQQVTNGKRKAEESGGEEEEQQQQSKRVKVDGNGGFPMDFFSDSSRQLPVADNDSDEEMADVDAPPAPTQTGPKSALDLELERFERQVARAPNHQDTYDSATVFAEAQLVDETPEGFPPREGDEAIAEQEPEIDEEELRRRKEQDERELIMDRLLDEERAQEEGVHWLLSLQIPS